MADCFMKNLRKKTGRAKESILESLGKADKTTDLHFEDLHADFTKQNKAADKLQSHLKTYVMSMRVANQALRGFHDAIHEVYEPEWGSSEHVKTLTHQNELIWDDFMDKLYEESLVPVNTYGQRFVDAKAKIAKRGRKLVDYDGARHALTTVQNSPKRSDDKVSKAQDDFSSAKNVYETLNTELLTELPELYESRTPFIINNLHTFYNLHTSFFHDTVQVFQDIRDQIKHDSLNIPEVTHTVPVPNGPHHANGVTHGSTYELAPQPVELRGEMTPVKSSSEVNIRTLTYTQSPDLDIQVPKFHDVRLSEHSSNGSAVVDGAVKIPYEVSQTLGKNHAEIADRPVKVDSDAISPVILYKNIELIQEEASQSVEKIHADVSLGKPTVFDSVKIDDVATVPDSLHKNQELTQEECSQPVDKIHTQEAGHVTNGPLPVDVIVAKDTTDNTDNVINRLSLYFDASDNLKDSAPSRNVVHQNFSVSFTVLYRVKATHLYKAEDTDELSFEPGDIIAVIPFTDEDEVDEGWAMGLKEDTGEKGVFPMNFTKNV